MAAVTVQDMLRARDNRAQRQQAFLAKHAASLISFTMNIAGEIKLDPPILRAFREGQRRIRRELERMNAIVLEEAETIAPTGCEMLWAVDCDAQALKTRLCLVEESCALGRLWDMDVIASDGAHLTRGNERECLICGAPVRACARSRAHSAKELYEKAHEIIRAHFDQQWTRLIGMLAQRALLYEAVTTPKPGLVDCENSGSHTDMNLFSFMDSAAALRPYLEDCAQLGVQGKGADALQLAGMQAEDTMLAAAHANTHKGAIFSLGILCYAAGFCGEELSLDTLLAKSSEVGQIYLAQMKENPTAQYRLYGLTGARGEVADGFPNVLRFGLPALRQALADGCTLEQAGLRALVSLMAHVHDSNVIRRSGMDGQRWVMEEAAQAGDLRQMNERFVHRNISPGGSADLLAVTYFLHFLFDREE